MCQLGTIWSLTLLSVVMASVLLASPGFWCCMYPNGSIGLIRVKDHFIRKLGVTGPIRRWGEVQEFTCIISKISHRNWRYVCGGGPILVVWSSAPLVSLHPTPNLNLPVSYQLLTSTENNWILKMFMMHQSLVQSYRFIKKKNYRSEDLFFLFIWLDFLNLFAGCRPCWLRFCARKSYFVTKNEEPRVPHGRTEP